MKPKVSVIIPVYNSEKYIERCIESVLNQTFQNFELIVINDGSKDNSQEILEGYKEKYANKIMLINQENMGVSKTRNKAIKIANGEYIVFIDNDDYIDNDYIETHIQNIEEVNADIVMSGYRRVNIDKKVLFKQKLLNTNWSKYIVLAPWAKIYKREFLLKNNIEFLDYAIGEDVYFNLVAFAKEPKIEIIDYIGYNWFFNTKSVSNTSQRGLSKDIDIRVLLDKILREYDKKDELIEYYFVRYFIWYMLFSGRKSSSKNFMDYYVKCKMWFQENKIKNKISPFSNQLKGESLKNRMIVGTFLLMDKLHAIKLFSKIYCKGKEE